MSPDEFRRVGRISIPQLLVVVLTVISLLAAPNSLFTSTAWAASTKQGRLTVVLTGPNSHDTSFCIVLRDLTERMVVGSYCDNDEADRDPRVARLTLSLPRRSFVLNVRAPGRDVRRITPARFDLQERQTVTVRLGPQ